jgi:hypothetical protein
MTSPGSVLVLCLCRYTKELRDVQTERTVKGSHSVSPRFLASSLTGVPGTLNTFTLASQEVPHLS